MSSRIEYIDLAKAVTIILVIVGHSYWHGLLLDRLIYSFHMPLFFILSGYFIKELNLRESIRKYSKAYIKPYLITCTLILIIYVLYTVATKGSLAGVVKIWAIQTIFASGWNKGNELLATTPMVGMIWFLVALFWACVIYSFLKKYSTKVRILFSTLIFLMGCISVLFIRLPFSIQAGMGGVLFLSLGDEMRQQNVIQRFVELKMFPQLMMLMCCVAIAIAICFGGVAAVTCSYGGKLLPLKVTSAIIACIVILSACKMTATGGGKIGRNTLYILMGHQLSWSIQNTVGYNFSSLPYGDVDNFVIELVIQILSAISIGYLIKKIRLI